MSAGTNALKLERPLLSPERSEVGQAASAPCRTHGGAAHTQLNLAIKEVTQEMALDEG